jgi:MFS family permease
MTNEAAMKRQVWLLLFCQALMHTTIVGQAVMAALIGHSLAENKALATLPIAIQMTATMAASIPAGIIFARLGRRAGFTVGALAAFAGSLIFAYGVWAGDFLIYTLGAIPAGLGFGIGQHYRFAASEVAPPAFRARAIGLVMTGGVLSAGLGPELVKATTQLFMPHLFLGTYLVMAVLPLLCLVLLTFTRLPLPPARNAGGAPVAEIIARPGFIAAVAAGMVAFGSMNLLMTSTPLEMMLCGFQVGASATVIQVHALSMYGPGFFTGRLIQRFGPRRIIVAGVLLNMACIAIGISGRSYGHFLVALGLLGLGWNFMFVGATTLLGSAHAPEERVRAQAANDLLVFGTVACTAFLSGAVHDRAGWDVMNLVILPPLLAVLALLLWQRLRRPRPAMVAAE